jgi:carboxymethylenebutenolidase
MSIIADLASLAPKPELSRRTFAVTSLGTGFALAVMPVSAATITTDSAGLEAGEVKIPVEDGSIPAYRAMPATGGAFPVILVVQEVFGVHEHIKDICRRFAHAGWLAVAPELYARQGDPSRLADIQELLSTIVAKVPDEQVMADLDATATWAKDGGKGDTDRLGITGFCWGGRIVWLYAAHNQALKAGVAWYGRLEGEPTALQPTYPLNLVNDIKAPILGLYGGQDQGIPVASVERMKKALAAAGNQSEFVVYQDAPHGFHADYRDSYREGPAKDGWQRCLAWLKAHGAG